MKNKGLELITKFREDYILHNIYFKLNEERILLAKIRATYKDNNIINGKLRALQKRKATPQWGNKFFIKEIYSLAKLRTKLTGVDFEVDHIIPLKHPLVCGLHNEFNLQILEKRQNRVKSNTFQPF